MVIEFSSQIIDLTSIWCFSQRKHAWSFSPKTHVVKMIKIITAIVTHTVILESFGSNFNNW